ncbi:hypothetical protein CPAR01_15361 [Colletotrichum paranaense]|uniref:Secreted protein n=3 Tax=Colletotrichum acutatum species complex TaxID=2707335 RepID=A0AAI9V6P7_9PEZI|nr:uncharacterized protein CPAR01_15361 [Colletotrichum paranaense]XP_060388542.1 uncharacterized protein CTAM01_01036 [Colletotrichum tamarilloi]KAI3528503.1 hypothetical protein CSPX01_16197 [Colletotrichum filicis]KAK1468723.1 hypothetical protein CMEL01_00490 [Colletotrichum melonis]KAK1512106.1 hypothetical protein CTAM01_01036 [Colletotrichum tamarilloi]KAK1519868.1 hypothetical protein CPAR01_15361 [Colletotrichum paranaense]
MLYFLLVLPAICKVPSRYLRCFADDRPCWRGKLMYNRYRTVTFGSCLGLSRSLEGPSLVLQPKIRPASACP